jgi:SM-20-related protein
MPKSEFFQRLGLYSSERFLDADLCRRLRESLQSGRGHAGEIGIGSTAEYVVDPSVRSVRCMDVGEGLASEVRDRVLAARPSIERFYNVALSDCQPLQFLAYAVGDHYSAHRDRRDDDTAVTTSRARRISVVIFLNERSELAAPNCYGGGALTFFGFFDHPSGQALGIPLDAAEGLLITFPADMLHAVTPVTHGERYTIATWFMS